MSSSGQRTRFAGVTDDASSTAPPTSRFSSPSTASTRSLPSPSLRPQQQLAEEPTFTLHTLLQTSQSPVAEGIVSRILWDVREDPLKAAQYVEQLGTRLSQETLNEFATTPPVPVLKVICEFPLYWECFISSGNKQFGGAGNRSTVPVYPPSIPPAASQVHNRSSSASVAQQSRASSSANPPPRPHPRIIPLPNSPTSTTATSNVVYLAPVSEGTQVAAPERRVVGITIGDLLSGLYDHLDRHGIRSAELESFSDKQRMHVVDAAEKRRRSSFASEGATRPSMAALSPTSPVAFSPIVASVPSTSTATTGTSATSSGPAVEGLKQVDKLMKHTWFAGLTVASGNHTVSLTLKTPTPNA